jgi:hypothetical protein
MSGRGQSRHFGGLLLEADISGRVAIINAPGLAAERDQFLRVCADVIEIGSAPAQVNPHVAAIGPTQLRQPLQECREVCLRAPTVCANWNEHADTPHATCRLRARHERPRGRCTAN